MPGAQRAEEQDGELELDRETAWKHRSIVGRGNFLAQDRPDVRYMVKELCREMSCPKMRSWAALKKPGSPADGAASRGDERVSRDLR